jgi:hypothetical protein
MTLDLSGLRRTLRKKTGEEDSVCPVLMLTLYSALPLAQIGPGAAAVLSRYVESIPPGSLRSAQIRDDVGPLTSQRIARDLKRLQKPSGSESLEVIVYSSSERGQPSDYGCHLLLWNLDDDGLVGPLQTNVLRFEFPCTFAEGPALESAVSLFTTLADSVPFICGTAAFGFSYWRGDRFAADQVRSMLPRYSAFDHSDASVNNMRGRTPCASWLTFLDASLLDQLGGRVSIAQAVPGAQVEATKSGVRIRAALRPPVGDVNRGAEDIGVLPSLARWLKPLRFRVTTFKGSQIEMDVDAWLQRFDGLQDMPWNNRE